MTIRMKALTTFQTEGVDPQVEGAEFTANKDVADRLEGTGNAVRLKADGEPSARSIAKAEDGA